jgi:hypothetical protein
MRFLLIKARKITARKRVKGSTAAEKEGRCVDGKKS